MAATNAVPVDASNAAQLRGVGRRRGCVLGRARRQLRPVRDPLPPAAAPQRRRSATGSACSTSDAAPGRRPCSQHERRPAATPSGSTCRRRCSTAPGVAPPDEGHRQRVPSSRRTRRSTRSSARPSTSPSATPARRSSETCVAGFTNVGRALRPGGRLVLLTWQSAGAATNGSASSRVRWRRDGTSRLHPRTHRARSRCRTPIGSTARSPSAGFTDIELEGDERGHVVRRRRRRRAAVRARPARLDARRTRRRRTRGTRRRRAAFHHGRSRDR